MKATIYGNINTLDEINSKLDIAEWKKNSDFEDTTIETIPNIWEGESCKYNKR